MGLKPTAFILLIVDKIGRILYSNTESININASKSAKNIEGLKFSPLLSDLLKLFQSSPKHNPAIQSSYKVTDLSTNNKLNVVLKPIVKGNNPLYSIELFPILSEGGVRINIDEVLNSINQNQLFLIIADGSGTILFFTETANNYLHNNFETLRGKKLSDIGDKYLASNYNKKFRASLFDGKYWQQDIKITTDRENYLRLILIPIRDDNNRIKSFILFGSDITKLMRENIASKKVGKLAEAVMDNIPGLIAILREKGDIIVLGDANSNFIRAFGLQKRTALNQDINSIFNSDFLNLLHKLIITSTVKRTAYFEYTISRKKSVHYGGKVICKSKLLGEENYYIVNMRDITDLLKYEKQLKQSYKQETYLNKLKTSFLVNMAIEIRTPYNSLIAYSNLIDEYLKEEDYDSVIELINSTKDVLKRVSNLFDNVTEVARIEAGDVILRKVRLDCNEVIRLAYYKIKEEVEQKKLDFELKLSPEKLIINADWVKIERVIYLLLDNALKYSSKGKILLEIQKKNTYANIIILDTGKGMSEEELNQLLEPFNIQEDDVGIAEGAGLGLTIASNYTKLMGGRFNIESKKGKGTKITLSFPLIEE
ncbi:MAG: PAS domain-containing sensor histidine kinase [Bacteroidetes bacterium]|nr:PAS domain-containing sensor histidine kinase [Bacteroidota bacterium]